jgi:hypothetical protein
MFQPKASRPISPARKAAGGGRNRLPAVVDDAHGFERRRNGRDSGPDAQRLQKTDRAVEQGDGSSVAAHVQATDESGLVAVAGEGQRGAQAHGSGADDGDVIDVLGHGALTTRLWTVRGLTINHGFGIADRRAASL